MKTITAKIMKTDEKQRVGRGFSREELKQAGTTMADALKLKIPIDKRRKTAHEENIETVKTFLKSRKTEKPAPKPKRKAKS
jgi:large subunit ribosomal protein L13e